MKTFARKSIAAAMGVILANTVAVHGVSLYDNTSTDSGNSLNFVNGQTLGNEIIMGNASPSDSVSSFAFEIYSPDSTFVGANVQMEVYMYANDGTPFSGYATPGTTLFDSGLFNLSTPQQYASANVATLNFDLSSSPVSVPNDFTLAAVVTGLDVSDTVGLELFEGPAVGSYYNDYWLDTGSGWQLYTNGLPASVGANFQGTPTPEPSTLYLGAVGAALLVGFKRLRGRHALSGKV